MNDLSKAFSLKYLSVLKEALQVNWASNGAPIISIDSIDRSTIEALKRGLTDLLDSSVATEAIEYETRSSRSRVVSVGFGLSGNFSDFVKLGLLCGDRVVLWDILASKTLNSGIITPRTSDLIAEIACNILTIEPLVEAGAVVLLPHPTMWSDLASSLLADLGVNNVSTSDVGFLTALVAILEGMQLHPYALASAPTPSHKLRETDGAKEFFSQTNQNFHKSVSELFRFEEMRYLRGVEPEEFYDCLRDRGDFQRALRAYLALPLKELSEQQKAVELDASLADLASLLEQRDIKILSYASGVGEATVGAISGTVAAFSVETAVFQAAALGVNSLVQFWSAGHKILQSPPSNILVQTFYRMQETEKPDIHDFSDGLNLRISSASEEARDAYAEFMSFYWTEERQSYLETLPATLVREVLGLIRPSDLQIIVNFRRHQEDYIGDFLRYLWGVDEEAFWDHLAATFGGEDGLLLYDDDHHIELMTSRNMPAHVWDSMLNAIVNVHWKDIEGKKAGFPLEFFPKIMFYQTTHDTEHVERRGQFLVFLSQLRRSDLNKLMWFIEEIYDDEIPEWLAPSLRKLLH
ncbi:hypothetical protein [Planktotalea arctica]|uniref:hypothetical protein n=1 Tax=Planktotalea arctica TaxID=1481893 RepID=UPI003219F013